MDKNKIIDKLLKKYPDLQEEPLFDELLSMDTDEESDEEMDDMGEAPSVEVEIEAGSEEAPEGEGDETALDDNEDARTEREIEKAMFDSSNEPDMLKEAANSDEMPADRLRELIKMRKKMKKA